MFFPAKLHVCRTCLPAMGKKQRGYIEYILSLMIFPAINVHLYGIFTCHVWLPKGNAIDPKTYGITWLDGLEMLTRRISSCGVTKRKGLRWLTVILSLIFTCSWSYAGTLFLDWFLSTDEVSTALQIKKLDAKIKQVFCYFCIFCSLFFSTAVYRCCHSWERPSKSWDLDGWDQGSGSQAITSKRCAVEATRMQ